MTFIMEIEPNGICDVEFFGRDNCVTVIVTELPTNPGKSVTNAWPELADSLCERFEIDPNISTVTWIEHYPADAIRPEETFDLVKMHYDRDEGRWKPDSQNFWQRMNPYEVKVIKALSAENGSVFFAGDTMHVIKATRLRNKWKWEVLVKNQNKKFGYLPREWEEDEVVEMARRICLSSVNYQHEVWLHEHVDYLLKNIGMQSLLAALIRNLETGKREEVWEGEYIDLLISNLKKTADDYSHRNDYLNDVEVVPLEDLPELTTEDLAALEAIPTDFINKLFDEAEKESDEE